MNTHSIRDQLHQQVDTLPDDLIQEIADFTAFLLMRRGRTSAVGEWSEDAWSEFALQQFMRDIDEDVEYTLDDAQEIYHE